MTPAASVPKPQVWAMMHDDVEAARHEHRGADRARDVAARVVGLLAERRGALEAREGEEAEDGGGGDVSSEVPPGS